MLLDYACIPNSKRSSFGKMKVIFAWIISAFAYQQPLSLVLNRLVGKVPWNECRSLQFPIFTPGNAPAQTLTQVVQVIPNVWFERCFEGIVDFAFQWPIFKLVVRYDHGLPRPLATLLDS